MDEMEVRKVARVDITGAFMKIDKEGKIFVNLDGLMIRVLKNLQNMSSILYGSWDKRYYVLD